MRTTFPNSAVGYSACISVVLVCLSVLPFTEVQSMPEGGVLQNRCLKTEDRGSLVSYIRDTTEKEIEDIISDKIFKIPEVIKMHHIIDSTTHHKHGISLMFLERPTRQKPYWVVEVGYNGEDRFQPIYNFYVYKPKLNIKYLDTVQDEIISLEEWRKREKRNNRNN